MIILDTDHISLLTAGGEKARRIQARLSAAGINEKFPTSIVTYEEQVRGWIQRFGQAKTLQEEIEIYRRLHIQLDFYHTLTIHDFTEAAAVELQRLRSLKVRIGTMDLKIAAIALSLKATVWTRNLADFRKVPGLNIEDATL